MAKKNRLLKYCELCKKITRHEVLNTNGQESSVCLLCQKKAVALENAEIACENQSINQKIEADRNLAEEAIQRLSINSPF